MADIKAADGKTYWNCWSHNYMRSRDGYCIHAFCEEDPGAATLCGFSGPLTTGFLNFPSEGMPSCAKCRKIMIKRGATND